MRKKFRALSLLSLLVIAGCNKPSEPSNPSTQGAVSETAKPTDKPTVGPSATVSQGQQSTTVVNKTRTIKGQDLVTEGETITLSTELSGTETPAITYSVDNTELAQIVNGNKLKGLKAGEVHVTAHRQGYTDSVLAINILNNITAAKASENGTDVTLKGIVKASDNTGYILADATDYVYVYGNKDANKVETGARIKFEGKVSYDSNKPFAFELTPTTVTTLDATAYQAIEFTYTASERNATSLAELKAKDGAKFVKTKSVTVSEGKILLGDTPIAIVGTTINDGFYDISGYIYVNNNKYYRYATESTAVARPAATALSFVLGDKADIHLNSPLTLAVNQTPSDARDELNWTISEGAHATVSDGVVTLTSEAVIGDKFTVTVTSKTNAEVKASIELTVVKAAEATTIKISHSDFTLKKDQTKLNQTVKGFNFSSRSAGVFDDNVRIYTNNFRITPVNNAWLITKIVFTCGANGTAKKGPGCMEGANYTAGTDKKGVWELASGASFVELNATKQCAIVERDITYVA